MSARELVVLGTSSQVPTRYRNHNAYFLRWDADGFLFDPGEGTQRQMILAGLAASQIQHILITHFHGDHALGLAGMIQRISLDRVAEPVHIYYPASGQIYFERLRGATIFVDQSRLIPHPIAGDGTVMETPTWILEARRLDHGVDTFGYRIRERDGARMLPERLAALGVRGPAVRQLQTTGEVQVGERRVRLEEASVPRPGQRFAFVMDTRPCPGARALAEGADLLVCESTYLESEREEAWAHHHMTARQAAILARDGGAQRLVLTHFSQRYGDPAIFVDEARPIFAESVAAIDLEKVEVPGRRA